MHAVGLQSAMRPRFLVFRTSIRPCALLVKFSIYVAIVTVNEYTALRQLPTQLVQNVNGKFTFIDVSYKFCFISRGMVAILQEMIALVEASVNSKSVSTRICMIE